VNVAVDDKRTGNGSISEPASRAGGLCAVAGCGLYGRILRTTKAGLSVLYCGKHSAEAERLFNS
jgi:hypothetical protein